MTLNRTVADFFAGIGLVSLGLQRGDWQTMYALDYDTDKQLLYEGHFGAGHYHTKNINAVKADEIPTVTLAHASFPCTNTSVAGDRDGLAGQQSSSFWEFARLLQEMETRRPPFVLVENVEGLLTSNNGKDVEAILEVLSELGYALDVLLIDASHFVPQSRVRLFILGNRGAEGQDSLEQEIALQTNSKARPEKLAQFIRSHSAIRWHLRMLPPLPKRTLNLESLVDESAAWWKKERTEYLFQQMFERHQEKVKRMMQQPYWSYGTVFRRMRMRNGKKRSTAELRTDGIAGCLRTPKGGSARQILFRAGYGTYDARLLNGIENARLMGANDYRFDKQLPLNQLLFGFGDAVCVPAVEWIAKNWLNPALEEINEQYEVPAAL